MIRIECPGDYHNIEKWLKKNKNQEYLKQLAKYGEKGVAALAAATPKDTGLTAASWSYEIEFKNNGLAIYWTNSHVEKYVNIAIILQFGHGTGTGGYVQGRDYINPAMRPIFDEIADSAWREVTITHG